MTPELIPLSKAARRLEMSDRHLRRKMAEGKINYLKRPGACGRVFFTDEQINKYIQTQMQP